jgi:hypothetical protein
MNERIKELIEKAEDPEHGFIIPEKLIELIVVECAMFVVTELEGKVGSAIADATANKLEEHFGVEE